MPAAPATPCVRSWKGLREELLRTPHGRERLLAGRPRVQGVEWMEAHAASIKQARRVPGSRSCTPQLLLHGVVARNTTWTAGSAQHPPTSRCLQLEAPHHKKHHRHRRRSSQPAEQQGEPAGSPAIAAQRGGSAAVPSSAFAAAAGGVAEELEGAAGDSPAAALDAAERRAARQSTGLTAYFTPDAELPAQELSADLPAAPHEPVPDASQQASQQAPSSSTPGGGGRPPAGKRRVEVVRATAEGRPLAPVEEHSGRSSSEVAGSSRGLAPSYSADKSASMDGSDAEEDVQVGSVLAGGWWRLRLHRHAAAGQSVACCF